MSNPFDDIDLRRCSVHHVAEVRRARDNTMPVVETRMEHHARHGRLIARILRDHLHEHEYVVQTSIEGCTALDDYVTDDLDDAREAVEHFFMSPTYWRAQRGTLRDTQRWASELASGAWRQRKES